MLPPPPPTSDLCTASAACRVLYHRGIESARLYLRILCMFVDNNILAAMQAYIVVAVNAAIQSAHACSGDPSDDDWIHNHSKWPTMAAECIHYLGHDPYTWHMRVLWLRKQIDRLRGGLEPILGSPRRVVGLVIHVSGYYCGARPDVAPAAPATRTTP